ncbi:MAG: YitT family protein [Clostridia bacterium]|nr:YitT family protein [Clostridia bacterium]
MQESKQPFGRIVLDYLILLGIACVMALNYQIFILSNAFAPSGLNGIATMLQYVFHFSVGYFSLIVNVPLAIACAIFVDKRFALRTLIFSLTFSLLLLMFQTRVDISRFIYHTDDGKSTLLAPVVSGAINGFIYGTTFRHGASTGGTDFIAAFVHKRHPAYSMSHVIFALNSAVALASYFIYDYNVEPVALCIIYSLITTTVSDRMLAGGKQAVKVEMITSHPDEVTEAVIRELHHSTTIMHVQGGYSHQGKTMLTCIINKHQITRMEEILRAFPDTFACVSMVSETMGNFKRIRR